MHRATIDKKSDGELTFTVAIRENPAPGRYINTSDVAFAGEAYGEVAEAIMDVEG